MEYVVVALAPNRRWGMAIDGVLWGEMLRGCWSEGGGVMGVGMEVWYEVGGFGHTGPSNTIQKCVVMDYAHGEP